MGPNPVWLSESLAGLMNLEPGMRVLDMGCGTARSSIFLAKEFGLQVWATDLWVRPHDNWDRICETGLESQVFPIHAEAHTLPYANGFFDALFSVDAYHYFGTDDLYIDTFSRLVKPGGQMGIVVPGIVEEFTDGIPEIFDWDFLQFSQPGMVAESLGEEWKGRSRTRRHPARRLETLGEILRGLHRAPAG